MTKPDILAARIVQRAAKKHRIGKYIEPTLRERRIYTPKKRKALRGTGLHVYAPKPADADPIER